ncbi:MAG: hypothetical protein ACLFSQ_05515 [Candidatus Zixiibacteriota bacterium]
MFFLNRLILTSTCDFYEIVAQLTDRLDFSAGIAGVFYSPSGANAPRGINTISMIGVDYKYTKTNVPENPLIYFPKLYRQESNLI